jgi:hypothetical protein
MAIPNNYRIEEVICKTDNLIVCRADHPIHGTVTIYMPDDSLPPEATAMTKRDLYQSGIQMRSISQLCLPFVTRTLEVSQNPNEPYIVTDYSKYDLQKLITENVKLKPKRVYQMFSQVLRAIVSLGENGWQIAHLNPYQIKLGDIHKGDANFTALPRTGFQTTVTGTIPVSKDGIPTGTPTLKTENTSPSVSPPTQTLKDNTIEKTQTLKNGITIGQEQPTIEPTTTLSQNSNTLEEEKEIRLIQRNIYILGTIAYHLLFGQKYNLSDNTAVVNIRKLGARWRIVLDKALDTSLEARYESYEAMLHGIKRMLSRNKRIAITISPFVALLVISGAVLGYQQYHRYQIMTSEAGQAIQNYLDIVNKTQSEFPEPSKLSSVFHEPNDNAILRPFDEIAPLLPKED